MYQHSSVFILVIRKSNFIFYNINKKPRTSVILLILLIYVVLLYLRLRAPLIRENIAIDCVSLCNFAVDDVWLFYTVEVTCSDSTFHSIPTVL